MRALAAIVLSVAAAACTPDIAGGAYLCGYNEECPDGFVCSGSDFACEDSVTATQFMCAEGSNSTLATATPLKTTSCVSSSAIDITSCLAQGTTDAWFTFSTPDDCASVGMTATVSFPYAFESIGMVLGDATGATLAHDAACPVPPSGEPANCLTMTLEDATDYTLDVVPEGGNDCDGGCDYNQYTLTIQLVTP
jgi:hypothetical protein